MNTILKLLLDMTIYSSIMILSVFLIKAMWQSKINNHIISLLWLIVLARLLMPGMIESPINLFNVLPDSYSYFEDNNLKMIETTDNEPFALETNEINATVYDSNDTLSTAQTAAAVEKEHPSFVSLLKGISIQAYILFIWLTGVCFVIIKNALAMIAFSKKIKKCSTISTDYLGSILDSARAKTGTKVNCQLINCDFVDMPVTCGLISPKILLPTGYTAKLSREKLELILSHELYHIKRLDMLKNYLWLLAKAIHWFNPLVWLAYSRYKDDVELAVDNMTLKRDSADKAILYSQSILDVLCISQGCSNAKVPLALPLVRDREKLKKRISSIVNPKRSRKSLGILSILIAIIMIIAGFSTACSMGDVKLGNLDEIKIQISETERVKVNCQPNENVTIHANVKFFTPEYDAVNIMMFEQKNLQAEHLNALIEYVFPDNDFYTSDGNLYNGKLTNDDPYGYKSLTRLTTEVDGEEVYIELSQSLPQNSNRTNLKFFYTSKGESADGMAGIEVINPDDYTQEEFLEIDKIHGENQITADEFVKALDGEDTSLQLVFSSIEGIYLGTSVSRYVYKRIYSGSNILHENYNYTVLELRNVEVASLETLTVYVMDNKILELRWSGYQPEYEVVEAGVELLDIEDITEVFINECENFRWEPRMFSLTDETSVTITLKKAVLGDLLVVQDREIVSIPVWNFIGDVDFDSPVYYGDSEIACTGFSDISILTINAIDGNVIYR